MAGDMRKLALQRDTDDAETPARAACVFYLRRASILTSPLHVKVSPEEKSQGPTWIKSIKPQESLFVSKNNRKTLQSVIEMWWICHLLVVSEKRCRTAGLTCQQRESPYNLIDFSQSHENIMGLLKRVILFTWSLFQWIDWLLWSSVHLVSLVCIYYFFKWNWT